MGQGISKGSCKWGKMTAEEMSTGSSCLETYKDKFNGDYKLEVLYFSSYTNLYVPNMEGPTLADLVESGQVVAHIVSWQVKQLLKEKATVPFQKPQKARPQKASLSWTSRTRSTRQFRPILRAVLLRMTQTCWKMLKRKSKK